MAFEAVVLAGGLGTRLAPLTLVLPKPMIPIGGKPMIEYVFERLRETNVKRIHVAARYLGHVIVAYYGGRTGDVVVHLLDSKDTADAVRLIGPHLERDDFVVTMGDVVSNIDFAELYEFHKRFNPLATIALKEIDNPLQYGVVHVNEDGSIAVFLEKPRTMEIYMLNLAQYRLWGSVAYRNLINTGFYVFSPEILEILEEYTSLMDFGRHVFPYLLENHYSIKGFVLDENTYWNDVGRVETYFETTWDLLSGKIAGMYPSGRVISPGVYVDIEATISGEVDSPVYIGVRAEIAEGAKVGPYVDLEEDVFIGKCAMIKNSIIWHRTRIGRGALVENSIIMNEVEIGENVKVVNSIIGTGNRVVQDVINQVILPKTTVNPYDSPKK